MNVFTREVKRTNSQSAKTEEVKKMLRQSFSHERRITDICEPDVSTEAACVNTFKKLEMLIRSDKRNILMNSANQGFVLEHLKSNMKQKGSFIKCLQDNEINVSLSHCNFLIAFQKLTTDYPDIIKCSLELRFFIKNLKIVKQVAPEIFGKK